MNKLLVIVDSAHEEDIRGPFPQTPRLRKLLEYLSKFLGVQVVSLPAANKAGSLSAAEYREYSEWLLERIASVAPTHILMMGKGATYTLGSQFPERLAKRRKWEKLIGRRMVLSGLELPALVTVSPSMLYTSKNEENAGYLQLRTVLEHAYALLREPLPLESKKYVLLDNKAALKAYLRKLPANCVLACDIETTGLNFITEKIFSVQFSNEAHSGVVVPWELVTPADWKAIFKYLYSKGIKLVGQNFKFDARFLMQNGVELEPWLELSVMHITEDERPGTHNLDSMSIQLLGEEKLDVDVTSFYEADLAAIKDYAAADVDLTYRIAQTLAPTREKRIIPIMERAGYALAQAEQRGILVNRDLLQQLVERATDGLRQYDELFESYSVRGPNDRAGVGRVLGLAGSTDKATLEPLALAGNELARAVVDARGLAKVLSTYLRRIEAGIQFDGRYHPDFRLAGPSTGRTSCGSGKVDAGYEWLSINLQNIPRPAESGHAFTYLSEELRSQLRHLFVADEGHLIVGADFSAAEFRVAAALSGDQQMITDCNNKLDTHSVIAINAFNLPVEVNYDDVSSYKPMKKFVEENYGYQRTIAKRGTFAALYGGAAGTIAANTGCSVSQAESILHALYGRYPDLRKYFDACHEAVKSGRIESYYGRVRRFPFSSGLFSREAKEAMLREGQNFTIQSTASDYGLLALGNFHRQFNMVYTPLLFVHDALYIQTPEDKVDECKKQLQHHMENADNLNGVILYADAKAAKSWGEL